ncbi:Histone acetyltransferase HPA2 [gamma proteobacterium IMCC1989]|nr:Histone acetyltransferase HPA2 [gamma proteobacterium IMCC1989]
MPQHATTDTDIKNCFAVMSELRPHLMQDNFITMVRHMEQEGYKLAFIKKESEVVAVAGYRISSNLFIGKSLYVNDLVTANRHRSKGYGEQLIGWLRSIAIEQKCQAFHLDSGTHRGQAHKFYFKQEFIIASYHFSQSLVTNVVVGNTIRI